VRKKKQQKKKMKKQRREKQGMNKGKQRNEVVQDEGKRENL